MRRHRDGLSWAAVGVVMTLLSGGCAERGPAGEGAGAVRVPAPIASGAQAVVEEYLRAATRVDGAGMYARIATSERDDESPKTLADTARDRYSPGTSWEILKAEEKGSAADVVVDFKGAKVDPNPYRFTLTREAGEWRIVQSPELHEDEKSDGIKIKID